MIGENRSRNKGEKMKECFNCKFRGSVAGSCHISCKFNWSKHPELKMPTCDSSHGRQWFSFPYNYDPCWGDYCPVPRLDVKEEAKEFTPEEEIASLTAGRIILR